MDSVRAVSHMQLQQIQCGASCGIINCRIGNSRKTTTVVFNGDVHNTKPFLTELYCHFEIAYSCFVLFNIGKE